MPPSTHDVTDVVKALLFVHEGKHGHEFYERQATGVGQTEEEHWLEELRAYRLEIEALRASNPAAFDTLLGQALAYLRASSLVGETKLEGYELHWEIPLPFEFSHLFQGIDVSNYERGVASILLLISSVEKILEDLYTESDDLNRELATFIQHLYKKKEIPSEE